MKPRDFVFRTPRRFRGFTLVELLVVIAVVAILVALAVPSFSAYARKAKRAEAQQLLMNWANNQEIWRANNPTYADSDDLAVPTHEVFTFTVTGADSAAYTLTATATGNQVNDKQSGTTCTPLTLDESGAKAPGVCW